MLRIMAVKCAYLEEPDQLAKDLLPRSRRLGFERSTKEKKKQIVAAYGLLRCGVREFLRLQQIPALIYGEHGKPAFSEHTELHFNLSHTDGLAVCAFSDRAVGVDVEKIKHVAKEQAERLRLSENKEQFYAEWVERESRIKCRGQSALLCRYPVEKREGEYDHSMCIEGEYALGICACCDDPLEMEWKTIEELFPF